jgi:hypothetical protein
VGDGLIVAGMRSAGEVHGEGSGMRATLTIFGSVQESCDEVVYEAIGPASGGDWDRDG